MKRLAQHCEDSVPQRSKKERERLIECVTEVLKEESDDEVVESFAGIAQDIKQNASLKEVFKSFHKNVWPLNQEAPKPKTDAELERTSSSVVVMGQEKGKEKLCSRLDHEAHPMHNDLVLQKIFQFCSVKDLKNIRLVSTKWRDLSLSSWRDKAVLCVDRVVLNNDMEALLQDGSEFRKSPFKHYSLGSSIFDDLDCKKEIENKFIDTFGPVMHYFELIAYDYKIIPSFLLLFKLPELRALKFQTSLHYLLEEYESIIYKPQKCPFQDLQASMSNLRKLELYVSIDEFESQVQFPWKRILENLPGLNYLKVKYEHEGSLDRSNSNGNFQTINLQDIMEAVCEVRKERNFSILNLEELDISETQHPFHAYRFDEIIARYIIESQLPLQRLGIRLGGNPKNDSAISNLFAACGETLQYLKCNNGLDTRHMRSYDVMSLPLAPYLPSKVMLANLKEIMFANGVVWAFHVLGSLDVPNLEALRIEWPKKLNNAETAVELDTKKIMPIGMSETFFGTQFLPNLSNFFYPGPRNFTSLELRGLAKAMPNVTDLVIPLGDIERFPIVYESWSRLQSLHVLANNRTFLHFDDFAVTGFPVEDNDDGLGAVGESRGSNITNLKELRKFVLETKLGGNLPVPRRALITDLSAVYGFLQLPKLRILQLETLCRFSRKVKTALESHLLELKVTDLKP